MKNDFDKIRRQLNALKKRTLNESIPVTKEWAGADVVITSSQPKKQNNSFYPEKRYVVTPNANKLSWLFFQLRNIFSDLYDGVTKIELFGRLANAALRYQKENENEIISDLLLAVLTEANIILDEMEQGVFQYLVVAVGNQLASEFELAKDWNRPEEDEAWSHLQ